MSHIHSIILNSDGHYTGFCEYREDGCYEGSLGQNNNEATNEDDDDDNHDDAAEAMEESFEEVQNEANSPNSINFHAGERMKLKLSVHFKFPFFSVKHVHRFVMQSPVHGWEITAQDKFNMVWIVCDNENMYGKALTYCFMNTHDCTKFAMNKM